MPTVSLDIWSENGKSILGALQTYIDNEWEIQELLLLFDNMSDVPHTGENIRCLDRNLFNRNFLNCNPFLNGLNRNKGVI